MSEQGADEIVTAVELAQIAARAKAATPGPWATGVDPDPSPVNDGTTDLEWWSNYPHIAAGQCFDCADGGEPLLTLVLNGKTYHAHRYPAWASDPWRQITSLDAVEGLQRIIGNYDVEEGGIATTEDDATFIAAARTDIPRLLATVEALRVVVEGLVAGDEDNAHNGPLVQDSEFLTWTCGLCYGYSKRSTEPSDVVHTAECPFTLAVAVKTRMGW